MLGPHNSDRSAAKDAQKDVKMTAVYSPLKDAILYKWTALTRRQTKTLNPAPTIAILGKLVEVVYC